MKFLIRIGSPRKTLMMSRLYSILWFSNGIFNCQRNRLKWRLYKILYSKSEERMEIIRASSSIRDCSSFGYPFDDSMVVLKYVCESGRSGCVCVCVCLKDIRVLSIVI